jgi:hypothetical protein
MNQKLWRAGTLMFVAALATATGLNGVLRGIQDMTSPFRDSLGDMGLKTGLFITGVAIYMWVAVAMAYADYKAEQAVRAPAEAQSGRPGLGETVLPIGAFTLFAAVFWLLA